MQHLGENTLAIVDHLAKNTSLIGIVPTSEIVFFDVHGMKLRRRGAIGETIH